MLSRTGDLRIESFRPLIPPAILVEELPLGEQGSATVVRAREEVSRILNGQDDRLVVIVGPCSIHDATAAMDYARHLKAKADELRDELCIIFRPGGSGCHPRVRPLRRAHTAPCERRREI